MKCIQIIDNKFLRTRSIKYVHDWAYRNKEERKCLKCGRKEMLYKIERKDGFDFEDWRQKL